MQQTHELDAREHPFVALLATIWRKTKRSVRTQIIGRIALSILAICVDHRIVPSTYLARPFFALGAFAILVLVSNKSQEDLPSLPRLSAARLTVFVCLHLLFIFVGNHFAPGLSSIAQSYSATASLISAARVLVVLPTVVLFPLHSKFFSRFAPELAASAIVLLTFFPNRYFHLIWPWYSKVLTVGATLVCSAFVPGTHLAIGTNTLVLVGPSVDMIIDFACSGITGIDLFHLVFGIVVIVEWNRLCKRRALICYVVGGLAYVFANFVRLVLLFLIGNLVSQNLNLDFLGWVLFAVTFFVLMKSTYEWMVMVSPAQKSNTIGVRAQENAA